MKKANSIKISKQEKLDKIFEILKNEDVTNYEISQNTGISESGLGSITNRETKNPRELTVNAIYEYLMKKYENTGEMLTETPTFKPEGRIIKEKELPKKQVTIIPIKGRGGLENAFFDKLYINELEKEELTLKYPSSKGSEWFKIEVEGISMDDSTEDFEGSRYSLQEGDWAYCRSVPKQYWRDKLHFNSVKVFCFFHNKRGIIFKKVISHNTETGKIVLHSLNKDKKKFPDFTINIAECSYICNVVKVLSDF